MPTLLVSSRPLFDSIRVVWVIATPWFIIIRKFDIIDYRGFYLTRVGYIRAIRRRVGWIKGFIHGCKSKIEIGEGGQGS